jgi:hypothetical protein
MAGSFGDASKKKKDDEGGFEVLGGTLLVEVAVDPKRIQVLYDQVKAATKQGVLDGYAEAAAEIATADQVEPVADGGPEK